MTANSSDLRGDVFVFDVFLFHLYVPIDIDACLVLDICGFLGWKWRRRGMQEWDFGHILRFAYPARYLFHILMSKFSTGCTKRDDDNALQENSSISEEYYVHFFIFWLRRSISAPLSAKSDSTISTQ